jgi:hypothetical protein
MKYKAQEKYDKNNTIRFTIKLNKNTDKEIIEALLNCGNKQGYIKEAIKFFIQNT